MKPEDLEAESRLQQAALDATADADRGPVDRYRYVVHAVRHATIPAPPAGFARRMEQIAADLPEQASAEQWLMRLAAVTALVLLVAIGGPFVAHAMQSFSSMLQGIPWRFVLALAIGLCGAATADLLHRRPRAD